MPTLTAQVSSDFLRQIDAVAEKTDRSRAWIIRHALRKYIDARVREEERWKETLEAMDAADRGEVVSAEEVFDWLDTWGQRAERIESDE